MTRSQLQLETSNGWTGSFDAETSCGGPQTQTNDQDVQSETPLDSSETIQTKENRNLNDPVKHENGIDDEGNEKTDEDDKQKALCSNFYCCRVFPRLSLVLVGILFPLWGLITISALFGFALSAVESPQEVDLNDRFMASRTEILAFSSGVQNFTRAIPKICLEIFLNQSQQTNDDDIAQMIQEIYFNDSKSLPQFRDAINFTDLVLINVTELDEHMEACGAAADPIVDRLLATLIEAYQNLPDGLTFNWIRCFEGPGDEVDITDLRYDAQQEYYQSVWEAHQQELYHEYLEQETSNFGRLQGLQPTFNETAHFRAFNRSIHEATGGTGCDYNTAASVWFWFTVMTTIGHGNQAPVTWQGRGLVLSLGFVSLLLFGLILRQAGRVTNVLFEDLLSRIHLGGLSRPWFLGVTWGFIYFGYMTVNAYYITLWKRVRLGETFSLGESYWFSYISFTTIGLGDYFIEPEVLLPKDMIGLPFLFLVGLTFFASFLEKLESCLPKGKRYRLLDSLIDRIQSTASIKQN